MSAQPHRMPLSRVVELLLTRGSGEHSSVTLNRNAKGETQIEVVVRTTDDGTVPTVEAAAERAQAVYDALRDAYPPAGGSGGA